MYSVESPSSLGRIRRAAATGRLRDRVGGTVLLLGTCSLLTDISSEMVTAILPIYLVANLGMMPLQYGVIDGIYQGASAVARLGSGFLGDRLGRHKGVASVGYGLSAVCKLGLAAIGGAWAGLSALIFLDRTGKGIRTAPRDAMISMSAQPRDYGLAFGVHRAMDTAGAMLGPLVAFALLAAAPDAFRSLFLVSFAIAALGVGVIVLLVREPARKAPPTSTAPLDLKSAVGLLRGARFRRLVVAGTALGLATASDGFVYLALLQQVDFSDRYFPLLATGTAVVYMVLAAPLGRLSDAIGRGRVFFAGYVVLLGVYGVLLVPSGGTPSVLLALGLLGAYYAATDGVLSALGSALVPEALRGSGLALLGTATSLSRLAGSVLFGALWTVVGVQGAVAVFAAGLVVAMAVTARGWSLAHA